MLFFLEMVKEEKKKLLTKYLQKLAMHSMFNNRFYFFINKINSFFPPTYEIQENVHMTTNLIW